AGLASLEPLLEGFYLPLPGLGEAIVLILRSPLRCFRRTSDMSTSAEVMRHHHPHEVDRWIACYLDSAYLLVHLLHCLHVTLVGFRGRLAGLHLHHHLVTLANLGLRQCRTGGQDDGKSLQATTSAWKTHQDGCKMKLKGVRGEPSSAAERCRPHS